MRSFNHFHKNKTKTELAEENMNAKYGGENELWKKKNPPFKYQSSGIVENLTQKSSGEEEQIPIPDMEKFKKWIAMLPVIIRG